ncbi:MAG: dockerin type I domain-containing protein [Gammaproteobacteria bacterium]
MPRNRPHTMTGFAALAIALLSVVAMPARAVGIFAPAAGQPASTAVPAGSGTIVAWASGVQNYTVGSNVDAPFRTPLKALGPAGNSDGSNAGFIYDIVSLGNGGSITLSFATPIADGPGFDFAVFENSFSDDFLEVAWVEVSSDGSNFVRFPAFSLTANPVSAFGSVDPTNLEGMAGKYRGGFGTPFDLAQLGGASGLDRSHVSFVRLVDIVGDGSAPNDLSPTTLAAWLGIAPGDLPPSLAAIAANAPAAIYDPYPTIGSAGLDLDAVGVINVATAADTDGDGVPDSADNCRLVPNNTGAGAQCDSDGDGFGNRCDGDLNNNGSTNAQDTTLFRQQLGKPSTAPTYNKADLNCNGSVNAQDTTLFRGLLGNPPGPSGL